MLATFGGGCFWCVEAVMKRVAGVTRVTSGYAGGHVDNPTYEQVCGKRTGHAEVVQVEFDPAAVSFESLLEAFFLAHDPTTKDRQGNDIGPQYRSIILYHDEAQRTAAQAAIARLDAAGVFDAPIVTEVVPASRFYAAEVEHHDYFARNPSQPYCAFVVAPKVEKFRKAFRGRQTGG